MNAGDRARADGESRAETSLTLSRGLSLLELLAAAPQGLTLAELATRLGLSRPAVSRLVATLVQHRLVRRSRGGVLSVALGVLELGRSVYPAMGESVHDALRDLAERTSATAHLALAEGAESVAVAVVRPRSVDVHIAYRVGSRLPVDQGALGRAILASKEGRFEVLWSSGEIMPGATGVAASLVGVGAPAAVGVVAPGPLETSLAEPHLTQAVESLLGALGVSRP